MKILSPLLKAVVYPTLSKINAFRRTANRGLAVVTYHGVKPPGYKSADPSLDGNLIGADVLRRQIRLLKKNYDLVSPEEVLAFLEERDTLPERAVLLTCDDGLLNCLTDMLPVLQEENVRCLFFVTGASAEKIRSFLWYEELFLLFLHARSGSFKVSSGDFVVQDLLAGRKQRRSAWWKTVCCLSELSLETRTFLIAELRRQFGLSETPVINLADAATCRRFGLLTCEELQLLLADGMSVGSHTITHPVLSRQHPDGAFDEIARSREMLESATGKRVWAFAYPFGNPQSVNLQVVTMARKAGYNAGFVNFGGGLGQKLEQCFIPRVHVTDKMSLSEFEAHVSGFYAQIQAATGRHSVMDGIH